MTRKNYHLTFLIRMWISCLANVTLPCDQKCRCLWQSASDAPKAVVFQVLPALHWCCCDFLRSHLWAVDKDLSNGGFWKHQVHVLRHSKKKKGGGTMSVFCFLEESMFVFYRASVDFLTLSRLFIGFSFFSYWSWIIPLLLCWNSLIEKIVLLAGFQVVFVGVAVRIKENQSISSVSRKA